MAYQYIKYNIDMNNIITIENKLSEYLINS